MRLLLDVHLPSAVAVQLRRFGIEAESLPNWMSGAYREALDHQILMAARADLRVFVTYDSHTFPDLLRALAAEGANHTGVVLVNGRTIRQDDVGGLVRALRRLVEEQGTEDWTDRVIHLPPA